MQGIRVEGIILKRKNLGEADRILSVFTLQKGKISVLAKGVRRITSRRSGNVELLNRTVMYLHQARNFLILTEASSINTFQELKEDLVLSSYAFHIIELIDKLTAENQENRVLYEHLVNVLQKLAGNPRQIFIRAFEAKILSNLGFLSFREYSGSGFIDSNEKVEKILRDLEVLTWEEIEEIKINKKEALELEYALRYHIEKIIETRLKSRQFLKKI